MAFAVVSALRIIQQSASQLLIIDHYKLFSGESMLWYRPFQMLSVTYEFKGVTKKFKAYYNEAISIST
jgi:hypothetical protein